MSKESFLRSLDQFNEPKQGGSRKKKRGVGQVLCSLFLSAACLFSGSSQALQPLASGLSGLLPSIEAKATCVQLSPDFLILSMVQILGLFQAPVRSSCGGKCVIGCFFCSSAATFHPMVEEFFFNFLKNKMELDRLSNCP